MGTLILAVTSLLFYSVGTALHALHFRRRLEANQAITTLIGVLALIAHGLLIFKTVFQDGNIDLSFFKSAMVISWIILLLLLALNLKKPLQSLFLAVYPLAILTIVLALITHTPSRLVSEQSYGMLAHVSLSVTAYSLFSLAGLQAILLYLQNRQLKHNYNSLLVRNLPPLQTMESVLFELVWAGVFLLVLAISTGALFVKDLFAQDLAHKTVFSLLSLAVFVGLLIGRYTRGWRGLTASRWTLVGCVLLMIAFYGTKFVLELLFHRGG
ncbi:cytochrome C assembly family protein [Marinobacter sp. C2H3]|uniref:cytochrome C assembly family protein n=1 Tax=Marinobacter sp. C2H3 TaxID=3119003 RepID=UPI00300EA225